MSPPFPPLPGPLGPPPGDPGDFPPEDSGAEPLIYHPPYRGGW